MRYDTQISSRKGISAEKRIKLAGFLFLLPSLAVISFSTVFPFLFNVILSFAKWDGFKKFEWVSGNNYKKLLQSMYSFPQTLFNTIYLAVLSTILSILCGLILALIVYRVGRKEGLISRLILFMPSMMPFAVVALLFTFILNNQMGLVNNFLRTVGLEKFALAWLSERYLVIPIIALVSAWKGGGAIMMLFYAALQMLPASLFESSKLDGAGYITQLRYIVIPLISPIIKLQTIMCLIGAFKSYDIVRVLTNGGPGMDSYTVSLLMLDTGFKYRDYGLASAMGCVLTAIILLLIVLMNKGVKSENYEY